jgi:hypothetical protein
MNEQPTCSYNTAHPHQTPVQCTAEAARDGLCQPHWTVTKGHHYLPGPDNSGYACIFCEEQAQPGDLLRSIADPVACPKRAEMTETTPYVYLAPDGGLIPFTKDGTVDEESVYNEANVARRALLFLMSLMPSCPWCHTTTCFQWAVFWLKQVAGPRGLMSCLAMMVSDLGGSISLEGETLDSEENRALVLTRDEDAEEGRVVLFALPEDEARRQAGEEVVAQGAGEEEWPEWIGEKGSTH